MSEPQIPDITLERYRLGELPADDAARIDDRVGREPALQARLAALERSDVEIRQAGLLPAPTVTTPRPFRRSRARWLIPAVAGLAAALLVTFVAPRTAERDDDRIKGLRPALALYRRTAAGSESLADGAVARPGDLVRVGYRAAGHAYGVIFSIAGRGNLTMHLPTAGDRAARLARDATVLLDAAYELDDAPMWERFYFVTGDAPFVVTPIVDAVRHAAALPRGLEQSTFSLQKEARP
jgi:hypothetical protein